MKTLFFLFFVGFLPTVALTAAEPVAANSAKTPVSTVSDIPDTPPPVPSVTPGVFVNEPAKPKPATPEPEAPAPEPPKTEPPPMPKQSDFERLPNGDIRIGQVTLDRKKRQISFPGKIQLDASMTPKLEMAGVLEVLITTNNGRLYEALLATDALPSHIQVMLILLGLNNGPRTPDAQGRQGDLVDIDIEWKREDGMLIVEAVENFLYDVRAKGNAKPVGWVFVGTTMQGGVVGADAEGNVALSWSSGSTVLDSADPESDKSGIFVLNPERAKLKAGTPIRIILTPRAKAAAKPAKP